MNEHNELHDFMQRLYQQQPDISTPEATEAILDFLPTVPAGDVLEATLLREGTGSVWRKFYGRVRSEARKTLRRATTQRTDLGTAITLTLQSKLPLPDIDLSPTLEQCGLVLLEKSIRYQRKLHQGMTSTIVSTESLAAQLAVAVERTGNPDLTVGEASAFGLIDWTGVVAV